MKNEIRVLIADDHQIILDGLKSLLDEQEGIHVVSTALNGREALEVLKVLTVEVVMIDIDMPVMNGLEAATEIKKMKNPPRVIILSMHAESGMVKSLVELGVDGYLVKNSSKDELVNAIKNVCNGKKVFSPDITMSLAGNATANEKDAFDFTERELEILKLITDGYSNREIGEKLFISHRTVDTHRTNMMKKAGVNNVAGLISFAIRNNLVD